MKSAIDFLASGLLVSIICGVLSIVTNVTNLIEHPVDEEANFLMTIVLILSWPTGDVDFNFDFNYSLDIWFCHWSKFKFGINFKVPHVLLSVLNLKIYVYRLLSCLFSDLFWLTATLLFDLDSFVKAETGETMFSVVMILCVKTIVASLTSVWA